MIIRITFLLALSLHTAYAMNTYPDTHQKSYKGKGNKLEIPIAEDWSPLHRKRNDINAPDLNGETVLEKTCGCASKKAYEKKAIARYRYIESLIKQGAKPARENSYLLNARQLFLVSLGIRDCRDIREQNYAVTLDTCRILGITSADLSIHPDWENIPRPNFNENIPAESSDFSIELYLKYVAEQKGLQAEIAQFIADIEKPQTTK